MEISHWSVTLSEDNLYHSSYRTKLAAIGFVLSATKAFTLGGLLACICILCWRRTHRRCGPRAASTCGCWANTCRIPRRHRSTLKFNKTCWPLSGLAVRVSPARTAQPVRRAQHWGPRGYLNHLKADYSCLTATGRGGVVILSGRVVDPGPRGARVQTGSGSGLSLHHIPSSSPPPPPPPPAPPLLPAADCLLIPHTQSNHHQNFVKEKT